MSHVRLSRQLALISADGSFSYTTMTYPYTDPSGWQHFWEPSRHLLQIFDGSGCGKHILLHGTDTCCLLHPPPPPPAPSKPQAGPQFCSTTRCTPSHQPTLTRRHPGPPSPQQWPNNVLQTADREDVGHSAAPTDSAPRTPQPTGRKSHWVELNMSTSRTPYQPPMVRQQSPRHLLVASGHNPLADIRELARPMQGGGAAYHRPSMDPPQGLSPYVSRSLEAPFRSPELPRLSTRRSSNASHRGRSVACVCAPVAHGAAFQRFCRHWCVGGGVGVQRYSTQVYVFVLPERCFGMKTGEGKHAFPPEVQEVLRSKALTGIFLPVVGTGHETHSPGISDCPSKNSS